MEVEATLERYNIWDCALRSMMADFAETNIGEHIGIVTQLTEDLEVPVDAAGCDLHLVNRCLQNAVKEGFGKLIIVSLWSCCAPCQRSWRPSGRQ